MGRSGHLETFRSDLARDSNLDSPGYSIPLDNPNADGISDRPEVLARGFRNPWSFAVDEPTGEIWIGDVGNKLVEELSVLEESIGVGTSVGRTLRATLAKTEMSQQLVFPVYDYGHDVGVAVMAVSMQRMRNSRTRWSGSVRRYVRTDLGHRL